MFQSVSSITTSIQLATHAPSTLANFLAVILDCEVENSCSLIIGATRFSFSEEGEVSGNLALSFNGFKKNDLELFQQRANFYHFREGKNLSVELTFHLPRLEKQGNILSLVWQDWNGRQWSFESHCE